AVVVGLDLVAFLFHLSGARAAGLARGLTLDPYGDWLSRPAIMGSIAAIGIIGAVAFARRPGRLWEGTLPLGALTLFSTAPAQRFGPPLSPLYFSGLCLLGWLVGLAVSRRRGLVTDESDAHVASLALLGAAYLNAGISKVVYGGADWLSGVSIQAVIV